MSTVKVLEEVLGVQCRLGEGRAVQVVLRVVDWKRECDAETSKGDDMADQMTDYFHAHKDDAANRA